MKDQLLELRVTEATRVRHRGTLRVNNSRKHGSDGAGRREQKSANRQRVSLLVDNKGKIVKMDLQSA